MPQILWIGCLESDEEFKIVIEKIRKDILKLKNGLDKR